MSTSKHRVAAVAAGATILVGFGSFGAVASGMITSSDIKNHQVKTADIDRGAVGSGKVKDGSLKIRDLDPATIAALQGAKTAGDAPQGAKGDKGDQGPQGPQGPKGDKGDDATVGISHWSVGGTVPAANKPFSQADPTDPTYMPGSTELVAECQKPGHLAIAGGYTAGSYKGGVTTYYSYATPGAPGTDAYGAGWKVGFTNMTDTRSSP